MHAAAAEARCRVDEENALRAIGDMIREGFDSEAKGTLGLR